MKYSNHPYLLIRGINLKAKAEKCHFIWNPILEKAEVDILSAPFIPDNPDGWLWEILDKTKERILRGCIAYKVTGDTRYFEAMKKQLWCLIEKWPWIEKYHHEEVGLEADLRTGIIMYTLGLVYDWMYSDFSLFDRKRVYSAIVDKGYPMLEKDIKADAFYLTSYGNNWLAVMLGGYAVAALATIDECEFSSEILTLAIKRTKVMATYVGQDGAWEEGPFYWGGIAFLVMFFDILDSLPASNTDLLNTDALLKTSLFPIYMSMPPSGRANFSDAHFYQDHNSTYLFAVMARVAKNPYYQWAFHEFRNISEFSKPELKKIEINDFRPSEETYQFISYASNLIPEYPIDLPLFKVFQGDTYGFVASRSAFGREDRGMVLCANGGTNGTNHHQLDIGQVIISYNKHNFIFDPGYGRAYKLENGNIANFNNYFMKNSMGHNIVTINGCSQINSPAAHGIISNCISNCTYDSFDIEMTSAYNNCSNAVRSVRRNRINNSVIIEDIFILNEVLPARLAWFYKGEASFINKKELKVTAGTSTCIIKVESMSPCKYSLESYSEKNCKDRAGYTVFPTEYNYLCIQAEPLKIHKFITTITFTNSINIHKNC